MQTITFNTGRTYTECGQRIAAAKLENGCIVMVDYDRHIDLLLPSHVALTKQEVMSAYDRDITTYASKEGIPYDKYYEIVNHLLAAASAVPCV